MQGPTQIPQRTVLAVTLIPVLAYGAVLTVPAFMAVLGNYYGMSSAQLGRLASVEWLACIAGTYLVNRLSIAELSRWVPGACLLAIGANIAAPALLGHMPLIAFHPLSTFGAGIAYAYALKVFDASGQQQRNFGIFLAITYLSELIIFQLINHLTVIYNKSAVFLVYASLALVSLGLSLGTRKSLAGAAGRASSELRRPERVRAPIWWSVAALGVSYAAFGMIWPFVQLMGVARGYSPLEVTNGTSAYSIMGILGALAAGALPLRVNRAVVLSTALGALLISMYLLYLGPTYAWFFVGCLIFGFYWTFYCTSHVAIIARADETGRGIVFCGVSPSLGAIGGSFVGGMLIHGNNYLPTGSVGALIAIVGTVSTLAIMARMRAKEPYARSSESSVVSS
jgi:hypothetical protein